VCDQVHAKKKKTKTKKKTLYLRPFYRYISIQAEVFQEASSC
jgi:hypothetical protein